MHRPTFIAALAFILATTSADAMVQRLCMQPSAPTTFLRKPTRPYCATTQSCSSFEVSSYRSDVEQYFRRLRMYAQEVEDFYQQAATYVECMSHLD